MKSTLVRACLLLSLTAVSASSQTAGDLKTKYGAPHESYEIRPGIFVITKYAADGQACEMFVEKRHIQASGTIDLDQATLSADEMKDVVNELVPAAARGEKSKDRDSWMGTGVGMISTQFYENVSINYYRKQLSSKGSSIAVGEVVAIQISWKNRTCSQHK